MIAVSSRLALPAVLILVLLAFPVSWHAIARPEAEDCADPSRLDLTHFANLGVEGTVASLRVAKGGGEPKHGTLLTRMRWESGPLWTVVRTRKPSESYFTPPAGFSFPAPLSYDRVLAYDSAAGTLPIHLRRRENDRLTNLLAYLYVFDGEPIVRPFAASLRHGVKQLVGGTLPLTAIVVEADFPTRRSERSEKVLLSWIEAAWLHYRKVCRP